MILRTRVVAQKRENGQLRVSVRNDGYIHAATSGTTTADADGRTDGSTTLTYGGLAVEDYYYCHLGIALLLLLVVVVQAKQTGSAAYFVS